MSSVSVRDISYTAVFAALIALGAFMAIPLGPVPFTLQPLFVLLAGLVLGARLGALSVAAYLVLGLVAPVYSQGTSGLGVLLGPTGGYLLGFAAGAFAAGLISHRGRASVSRYVTASMAGLLPIYLLGASWLAFSLQTTDAAVVLVGGVLQFLPFDVVKALLASVIALRLVRSPLGPPSAQTDR